MTPRPADREAGFSLIEIVIALGLFSLISLAGVVLVGSILQVRDRTEGRLEELGSLQRGLMVITSDFQQSDGGSLKLTPSSISVDRQHGGRRDEVKYVFADDKILRIISSVGAPAVQQTLLENVGATRWRVLLKDRGWVDAWPSAPAAVQTGGDRTTPIAVAVELDLARERLSVSGTLRRIVELTGKP